VGTLVRLAVGGAEVTVGAGALVTAGTVGGVWLSGAGGAGALQAALTRTISPSNVRRKAVENLIVVQAPFICDHAPGANRLIGRIVR
jgi:hypothetical protein